MGHCNLYRIHPSKQPLWNTWLQGVTIYALRAKRVVDKAAGVLPWLSPSLEPALGMIGTLTFSVQMAQSKILVLALALLLPVLGCDDGKLECAGEEDVA